MLIAETELKSAELTTRSDARTTVPYGSPRGAGAISYLAYHKPKPRATLRLFCFPYAGGSALIYREWGAHLPEQVEVCPVQLPGRGHRLREPPLPRMQPLAEETARALQPLFDKPFAFFGHSMGAVLAFEIARLLRARSGPSPSHLFVSGRQAPQVPETAAPTYDLPEPEFIEELRRLNGTPPEVLAEPELMQVMLPLLRADFEAVQTYTYREEPPLDCPLSVYGGGQDEEVSREELEGWCEQTNAACTLRLFPGDHFFLNTARDTVLRTLTRELYERQLL
jgi:medium-chain acyl-[acyl-carrier-protein] hydrolase